MNDALSSRHDALRPGEYHHGVSSTGQRIREKREALGLSQEKLAHEVQVTRNTVASWENKDVIPKGETLDKLALALGITADWILRGDRRRGPSSPPMPDPPHWADFVARYKHLGDFTEEQLEDIKRFAARQFRVQSWTDFERIAEIVRTSRPSPTFEAKKKARRGR